MLMQVNIPDFIHPSQFRVNTSPFDGARPPVVHAIHSRMMFEVRGQREHQKRFAAAHLAAVQAWRDSGHTATHWHEAHTSLVPRLWQHVQWGAHDPAEVKAIYHKTAGDHAIAAVASGKSLL